MRKHRFKSKKEKKYKNIKIEELKSFNIKILESFKNRNIIHVDRKDKRWKE